MRTIWSHTGRRETVRRPNRDSEKEELSGLGTKETSRGINLRKAPDVGLEKDKELDLQTLKGDGARTVTVKGQ